MFSGFLEYDLYFTYVPAGFLALQVYACFYIYPSVCLLPVFPIK